MRKIPLGAMVTLGCMWAMSTSADEFIIKHGDPNLFPAPIPLELMPMRYHEMPVAYALWMVVSTGETCSKALQMPMLATRSRLLGEAILLLTGSGAADATARVDQAVRFITTHDTPEAAMCPSAMAEADRLVKELLSVTGSGGRN